MNAFINKGSRQAGFEQTLLNSYKEVTENNTCEEGEATNYKEYLKKCHELPYYGFVLFVFKIFGKKGKDRKRKYVSSFK